MRDNAWLFVQKIGTVLADRRFWVWLFGLLVTMGILPATTDAGAIGNQTADAILLVVQGATALFGVIVLLYSWAKRPPSGLNYKELPTEIEKLIPVLSELFKNQGES